MKKFAIVGFVSILATLAFTGCMEVPNDTEELDTAASQEEVVTEQEEVTEDVAPEPAKVSLKDYIGKMDSTENMVEYGTEPELKTEVYVAKAILDPCAPDSDGVCGFDLGIVAAEDWDEKGSEVQPFYLVEYSGVGLVYYGPFEDNLERILNEAKSMEAGEMLTYSDDLVPVVFDYSADFEVEAGDCEKGFCRVRLGDERNQAGYLRDIITIVLQTEEYAEKRSEEGGIYMPYSFNLCENKLDQDLVRECKTEDDVTSYFAIMNRGDLIYTKSYYLNDLSEEWSNVQVEVSLLVDGYELMSEDESEQIVLNDEQLSRIEMAEEIIKSLQFVGI